MLESHRDRHNEQSTGAIFQNLNTDQIREFGLPVVMIARPDKPAGDVVTSPQDAIDRLAQIGPRSPRGV